MKVSRRHSSAAFSKDCILTGCFAEEAAPAPAASAGGDDELKKQIAVFAETEATLKKDLENKATTVAEKEVQLGKLKEEREFVRACVCMRACVYACEGLST